MNQHYRDRGGNANGIPVVLVGLEKDGSGEPSGGTLTFAERTGLELVVDDSDHEVLHQFFSPQRGEGASNSDFVILNGVANSPSHQRWEIVYTKSLRPSVSELRNAIDSIEAGAPVDLLPPAAPLLSAPQRRDDRFEFWVKGAAGYQGRVEASSDGRTWTLFSEIEFGNEPVLITDPLGDSVSHRLFRVTIGDAVP